MSGSQIHVINYAELSRSENLHTDLRQGLKLIELSLFGVQDPTRGPHVDPDDLGTIAGFVMEMQEKFDQYSDAVSRICQEQPAQLDGRGPGRKKGGVSGQQ